MLTRIFVAGEDAAHLEFVSGFLDAFGFPPRRVTPSLDSTQSAGREGDGKQRMFADAREFAKLVWNRRNHQSCVLVVLHDRGEDDAARLHRSILKKLSQDANIDPTFLADRMVVLLPTPETEGWIAEMLQIGYEPSHIGTKRALKAQAFHFGKEAGKACRRGEQGRLPGSMRPFCDEVARHTGGLR